MYPLNVYRYINIILVGFKYGYDYNTVTDYPSMYYQYWIRVLIHNILSWNAIYKLFTTVIILQCYMYINFFKCIAKYFMKKWLYWKEFYINLFYVLILVIWFIFFVYLMKLTSFRNELQPEFTIQWNI